MEKRLIQLLVLVTGLIIVFFVWDPFWRQNLDKAVDPNAEDKIIFEVQKGESAKQIAKELKDAELIFDDKSFTRAVKEENLSSSLRYGKFLLSRSMSTREIIDILSSTGTGEMALTIVEGWTVNDIDAYLSDLDLISPGDFRKCTFNCSFDYDFLSDSFGLEGFLFPDTYFIDSSTFTSEAFINRMLQNFDSKFTSDMRSATEAEGRTIQEVVNVASMLEREVHTEEDIAIVSGIIWKRLDNDWPLGIDATLLYVQDDNELSAEDLQEDSPYNTRINTGLPPTPISNPGLASLKGAVYPEDSDYWFYLTEPENGEVIYAKTNAEHEANKEKYL